MTSDKIIIEDVIEKIMAFQSKNEREGYSIHPLDKYVLNTLKKINGILNDNENQFEIFKQIDTIKELWTTLIEKSIICLRYYDKREPFLSNSNKQPHAYGISQLNDYFTNYLEFESMLYGGAKYYRDHVVHVFRVWLLGIKLLLENDYLENISVDKVKDINQFEKLSIWTLIALTHDLGYPLEKALQVIDKTKNMMKSFIVNPTISLDLSFSGVQNSMNDFVLRLISSKMKCIISDNQIDKVADEGENIDKNNDKEKYVARLQPKYYFKLQKSLEHNKHGVLSALIIYKMLTYFLESDYSINEDYKFKEEDARQFYIRREILRSIASHTCSDIYQLDALNFSFLLIIADDAQEWGRKNISELYTIHQSNKYSFNNVSIEKSEDNHYVCIIDEEYELSDSDYLPSLIDRFIEQGKNYRDLFRDGQDTMNRNFSFLRTSKIKFAYSGGKKNYVYELNIPFDKQASSSLFRDDRKEINKDNDPLYKILKSNKKTKDLVMSLQDNKIEISLD